MTLDETIKHYDEVAEAEERSANLHQRPDKDVKGSGKRYLSCIECAKEHRQLAEWLKELKELKKRVQQNEKAILEIQKDFKDYVDLLDMPRDDYKGIMEYVDELSSVTLRTETEVNADADSD